MPAKGNFHLPHTLNPQARNNADAPRFKPRATPSSSSSSARLRWRSPSATSTSRVADALWVARASWPARRPLALRPRHALRAPRHGRASMFMVALHIPVGIGQNLYHFVVFVTLAVPVIYRDWRVPLMARRSSRCSQVPLQRAAARGWGVSCFTKPTGSRCPPRGLSHRADRGRGLDRGLLALEAAARARVHGWCSTATVRSTCGPARKTPPPPRAPPYRRRSR